MKRKAKQDDVETYVIAFKELISEAVSSMNREEALKYITKEVLPNVKTAFTPEKYQEIKRYAEENSEQSYQIKTAIVNTEW